MPVALGPTNLGLLNEQLHQALELVLVSCNIKSSRGQLEFTSLSSLALWGARCNLSVKKKTSGASIMYEHFYCWFLSKVLSDEDGYMFYQPD